MSEKIDKFCENLRVKMTNVESNLNKAGENLKTAPQQAADGVRSRIDSAKAHHLEYKQRAVDAKVKLDEHVMAKKAEVKSEVAEWKTNREIHRLEAWADEAESYAEAALEYAAACVVEADLATLEAIEARLDAEEAASRA